MSSRIEYNNPKSIGNFAPAYHFEMVADSKRVIPFKKAIEKVCKEKIVLESGAGTGILSLLAAKSGARMVYTVEIDPIIAKFAMRNIRKNRYKNIRLIQKDILNVNISDLDNKKADVVIAENLSTWLVTEPQVELMNHINQYLAKAKAIRLPTRVFNYVELVESQYNFEDLIEIRTHYFQFSGIQVPKTLSEQALFQEFNFYNINPVHVNSNINIKVLNEGILNSIRLTSPLEIYEDIRFEGSDSLMPPVIFPLEDELHVRKGDQVKLQISYKMSSSWNNFSCYAKK